MTSGLTFACWSNEKKENELGRHRLGEQGALFAPSPPCSVLTFLLPSGLAFVTLRAALMSAMWKQDAASARTMWRASTARGVTFSYWEMTPVPNGKNSPKATCTHFSGVNLDFSTWSPQTQEAVPPVSASDTPRSAPTPWATASIPLPPLFA